MVSECVQDISIPHISIGAAEVEYNVLQSYTFGEEVFWPEAVAKSGAFLEIRA